MLHVILLILKIIGILLAVILGILVLMACIVLFVPVHYEAQAAYPGRPADATAAVKVSWLLRLFAADAAFRDGTLTWKARVAWLHFGSEEKDASAGEDAKSEDSGEAAEKEKDDGSAPSAEVGDAATRSEAVGITESEKTDGTVVRPETVETAEGEKTDGAAISTEAIGAAGSERSDGTVSPEAVGAAKSERIDETVIHTKAVGAAENERANGIASNTEAGETAEGESCSIATQKADSGTCDESDRVAGTPSNAEAGDTAGKQERDSGAEGESAGGAQKRPRGRRRRRRPHPLRALQRLAERFRKFLRSIKCTFRKIYGMIEKAARKKEELVDFVENEAHRRAFARAKKELVWVKRLLMPCEFRTRLHFGFKDPSSTGRALAALSMIYPLLGDHMDIQPEFEQEVLDGELYIRGRLRMIHGAMLGLRMLLDKNVRRTYRDVRRMLG